MSRNLDALARRERTARSYASRPTRQWFGSRRPELSAPEYHGRQQNQTHGRSLRYTSADLDERFIACPAFPVSKQLASETAIATYLSSELGENVFEKNGQATFRT